MGPGEVRRQASKRMARTLSVAAIVPAAVVRARVKEHVRALRRLPWGVVGEAALRGVADRLWSGSRRPWRPIERPSPGCCPKMMPGRFFQKW